MRQSETLALNLLTLVEAAELLHVSPKTVHRMILSGDLPAFKVGAQWRVDEGRLIQWLKDRSPG
jgi:excisionase family DNA binding protein